MEKSIFKIVFPVLLAALILCGCGGQAQEPVQESPEFIKIENMSIPELSEAGSRKMQSFMSGGRACINGGVLYCLDFDESLSPVLAAYELSGGGPEGFRIIQESCCPEFLCEHSGRLYYINSANNGSIESIKPDGSGAEILKEGPCDFLRIEEGKLYYCDGRMRLYEVDLRSRSERVIMPEACYYPYVIDNMLIYQRGSDEHLHIMNLETGTDEELTELPAYSPVVAGGRLYCSVADGVLSVDLDGINPLKYRLRDMISAAECIIRDGKTLLRGSMERGGLCSWSFDTAAPEESFSAGEKGTYRLLEHAGDEYMVFTDYQARGRIANFRLTDSEGNEISYFQGETW